MTARLERWFVTIDSTDPFRAPELCPRVIKGNIFGDPRFTDGASVVTGAIRSADGRNITTHTDERYELGEPDPGFADFMATRYPGWSADKPFDVPEKKVDHA